MGQVLDSLRTCQIQVDAHFVDPLKTNDARV
jgi:hypothetical protein